MTFLARVLAVGLSRNAVRWPRQLADQLAAALADAPVRAYKQGGHLHHPREGDHVDVDLRGRIGHVTSATATEAAVWASVDNSDEEMVEGLLTLERQRRLARTIGVSISADIFVCPTVELGRPVRLVTRIRGVRALDLVSFPSADDALLKSLDSRAIAP